MKEYDGLAEKWNGLTASGKEAPAAPYFCIVEATDKAGGTHEKQGIVYLFRDDVDVSPNPALKQVLVQTNGRIPGERIVKIIYPNVISSNAKIMRKIEEIDERIKYYKKQHHIIYDKELNQRISESEKSNGFAQDADANALKGLSND